VDVETVWIVGSLVCIVAGYIAGTWQRKDEVQGLNRRVDKLEEDNDRLRDAIEQALPKIPTWVRSRKVQGDGPTIILERALGESDANV
jgi:hypothetical protein